MEKTIYDLHATDASGRDREFGEYRNNVLLVVNTASKCGFTPQYKGLEALYKRYKDSGLVVLGFPCDQFGHQEPGDNAEIVQFCEKNYGVTFPLMAKISVNGKGTHPVFQFLKKRAPGAIGQSIKWNFTKFLVDRDGRAVRRYAPNIEPEALTADIEKTLSKSSEQVGTA